MTDQIKAALKEAIEDAMIRVLSRAEAKRVGRTTLMILANEAAIAAAERQAEAQMQMFQAMKDQFERGAEIAARMYGIPIPPKPTPTATVLTNAPSR
jgi:hypothetical protein